MNRRAFKKAVAEEFPRAVPEKFRAKIKNVAILVEDEPSEEVRRREGLAHDETLLGYYQGVPATARGADYGVGPTMPDTITLYQRPIEEEAGDNPEEIRRVIRQTIWHEAAHYFGLDEGALRRREDERGPR